MHKILKLMKKIKIKNLIILLLLLVFNSYAWFVYTTKVSGELSAHVSSWDVQFVAKDGGVSSYMNIEVAKIYPGMEDFEQTIDVQNRGEVNIELSYEIEQVKILDESFSIDTENGVTSESIDEKLKNDYPFKITVEKDDTQLMTGTGNGSFKVKVVWPYESGDDDADSKWGMKAYEFYENNPDEKCIEMKLLLKATQAKG